MNFYCDSGGVIFHVDPERIFQGSAGVNKIRFIGQFPSNAQVLVSYKLPNGIWTVPKYMTFVSALEEVQAPNGGIFCVWESLLGATPKVDSSGAPVLVDGVQQYELDYTITQNAGTVDVQFFVYVTAEQSNVQNGARLATEISSITVEKGVPVVVPEYSETDDYEVLLQQILTALNGIVGEYQDVEQRLTTAEDSIGVLQEEAANLRTEVDELTNQADDLDAALNTAEQNIETNTQNIADLENSIDVLGNDVTQLKTAVSIVQIKATNLQNEVDGITTDVQNIREALDIAEITETVEVTDKYNSRQTANGLTLYPEQPTTLLKVEGDTIAAINKFNALAISNSNITVADEGRTITLVVMGAGASPSNYGIGKLKDLCPTLHIGDSVYLYGTGAIYGLCNSLFNNLLPFNSSTATVLTDEILNTNLFINCGTITSSITITDLQITKVQNAPWTPYFEGLKSASFAGIEIGGSNLFNALAITPQAENTTGWIESVAENEIIIENKTSCVIYTQKTLKELCPRLKVGDIVYLNADIVYLNADASISSFNLYGDGKSTAWAFGQSKTIEEWMLDANTAFAMENKTATYYVRNMRITVRQNAPFAPYILETWQFPNTVNPLGQTIDFENKKIVDYGVELVLTGTENLSYYNADLWGSTGPSLLIWDFLPESGSNFQSNAVSTDGYLEVKFNGTLPKGNFVIANGNRALWWYGCFNYLGLDASWSDKDNPTAEEQTTAISNLKVYLAQRYADGNPVTIRYVAPSVQNETPFTAGQTAAGDSYLPYTGGTETVDNATAEWDLENNITQEYDIVNKIGG